MAPPAINIANFQLQPPALDIKVTPGKPFQLDGLLDGFDSSNLSDADFERDEAATMALDPEEAIFESLSDDGLI